MKPIDLSGVGALSLGKAGSRSLNQTKKFQFEDLSSSSEEEAKAQQDYFEAEEIQYEAELSEKISNHEEPLMKQDSLLSYNKMDQTLDVPDQLNY